MQVEPRHCKRTLHRVKAVSLRQVFARICRPRRIPDISVYLVVRNYVVFLDIFSVLAESSIGALCSSSVAFGREFEKPLCAKWLYFLQL